MTAGDLKAPLRGTPLVSPAAPARLGSGGGPIWKAPGGAMVRRMPDGRLHMQHGPIDILARAWGDAGAVAMAERRASARFGTVLAELSAELAQLRRPDGAPEGPVARLMAAAVAPFRPAFITPMAAVAGAVAEAVLAALTGPGIRRAYSNNGGDIALHLDDGEQVACAIAARPGLPDRVVLRWDQPARGVATSGWRGRSFSLGIADAVTVLARTAAMADAAATMIANAVDLPDHPGIRRRPARDLRSDSDLGGALVTVDVPVLSIEDRRRALARGLAMAEASRSRGLIEGAALFLQGEARTTGVPLVAAAEREP